MKDKGRTVLDQIAEAINAVLPKEMTEDVRKNVKAALRSTVERMDLVTREELEVQEAVLARTRKKLEQLETLVAELEQRTKQISAQDSS